MEIRRAIAQNLGVRAAARWMLLLLGLWFTLSQWAHERSEEAEELPATESTIEFGSNGLAADLRPLRVGPGGGFLIDVRDSSGQPRPDEIDRVTLDKVELRATTLIDGRRMFRVPEAAQLGRRSVQVHLRDHSQLSAGIELRRTNQRKIVRNIVGGLAMLLYGVRVFSKGLRRVASRRLQRSVGRLTQKRFGAMVVGLFLGPMTQTGASAVGIVSGFVESRLIKPIAALWLLWGTLLSLSAAAALLPFVSFREALIFVGVGVVWLMLSQSRRQRAVAQVLLGSGLFFHGVHLTRIGFASLVSTPEILAYASFLQTDTLSGWLICWASGLILSALFQGPSALVVLVLGLLEALGLVGVPGALAILAGAFVGTPLSALALIWPFGRRERRIVGIVTALALITSVLLLILQPLLLIALDPLVEGDPNLAIWGKKQVLPFAASHLIATHIAALCTIGAISGIFSFVPQWIRNDQEAQQLDPNLWFEQWLARDKGGSSSRGAPLQAELLRVLAELQAALPEARNMVEQGDRQLGTQLETRVSAIREASSIVLGRIHKRGHSGSAPKSEAPSRYLRSTALTLFHLEHALDRVRMMSDSFIERGERLRDADRQTLEEICGLLSESIDEIAESIREQYEIDLESIQSREIQINAMELEHRRRLDAEGDRLSLRGEVLTAELVSGLENLGNQLYRLVQSLDGMPFGESSDHG